MILGDFHIHSTFSDGKLTIPELVDFYGSRGFGAIAITDHLCEERSSIGKAAHHLLSRTLTRATFPLYQEILKSEAKRAWNQYQMLVIPGFEITKNTMSNKRSAHMLALGVTEWVSADQDVRDISKQIRALGGLTIAAHPVPTRLKEKQTYYLWDRRQELAPLFDAWEVASGKHLFEEVLRSGLPMLASSDLHQPRQITSWKTLVDCDATAPSVLAAIRAQKITFTYFREETPDVWLCDLPSRPLGNRHGSSPTQLHPNVA